MNPEGGATARKSPLELSIVVPFYNEEKNVEELYAELKETLDATGREYELVFVDDGSTDRTLPILKGIYDGDPRVRIVRLRRNFGQTGGLAAGIDHARGEIIISMDGDLQHDPSEIPRFLEKIDEGYDIVSGWRKERVDNLLVRKIPSWVANRIMSLLSGVKIHDFGTTFKAYRREVIKNVDLYGEMHRFVPALASRMGVSIVEVPIRNILRKAGKSKYGLSRTRGVLLDLIAVKFFISYMANPLRIFGSWGLLSFALGFAIAMGLLTWSFITKLNIVTYHEGLLILAVLAMMMGVQFITMGLLGEMVARIYHKIENRPPYVVKRVHDHADRTGH